MNKKMVIISTIVLIFDQILKSIVQISNVHFNILGNILKFNYYQNTGAAWSILQGKTVTLIIVSILMLILVYSMSFSYDDSKMKNLSFGLLYGGIVGNLIDRIFYGFVRDFIDIRIFGYNFPIFNIADMAIVIGVIILVVSTIKGELKSGNKGVRRRMQAKNR